MLEKLGCTDGKQVEEKKSVTVLRVRTANIGNAMPFALPKSIVNKATLSFLVSHRDDLPSEPYMQIAQFFYQKQTQPITFSFIKCCKM